MNAMPTLPALFNERVNAATLKAEAKAHADTTSETSHEQYAALDSDDAKAGVNRYLLAGIEAEAEQFMRTAEPGNRNEPLHKAACAIFELANSSPNFDIEEIEERLIQMGEASGHDPDAVRKTVASARRRTDGKGRDVQAIAAKRAGAVVPEVAVDVPECPPRPHDVEHLRKSASGKGNSESSNAVKKKVKSPAVRDAFWGAGMCKPEERQNDVAAVTRAARKVPGATPELVFAIVDRDPETGADPQTWATIWRTWHAPDASTKAKVAADDDERPRVQLSSDHFETYRVFADALSELNKRDPKHPTTVLNAAGRPCRFDADGTTPLDKFGITYHLSSLLRPFTYRQNKESGEVEPTDANVPREVVELFLGAGAEDHRRNFVTVEKASNKPCIDPTTGEVTRSGYDAATRTFVRLAPDMLYEMPEGPVTAEQLAAAVAFVRELLHDFCWSSAVDFANAVAMLLTGAISGSWGGILTPLFGIDGPMQGSGKSLLAWLGAASAGVVDEASVSGRQKGTEAELDKTLASEWARGRLVVVIDNVEDKLDSGDLTRACTELRTSVRLLGGGTITICCNILKVATGNNLTYSADLAKRVVRIYLDPRRPDPENRSGWKIGGVDELKAHVRKNQGKLIAALHVMVLAWIQAGRQEYEGVRTHGRFPDWSKVVGNVLAHAGIEGFLANKEAVAAADDETTDARRILAAVKARADQLQTPTFQVADVARYLNEEVKQLVLDGKHPDRLNVLLGRWLGKHVNTPVVIDTATWTLQSPGEDRVGTRLYQFEKQQ